MLLIRVCALAALVSASPHSHLEARQDNGGALTVPLTHFTSGFANYFGISVGVGTPPQQFNLALNLQHPSVDLIDGNRWQNRTNIFMPNASSTFVDIPGYYTGGNDYWVGELYSGSAGLDTLVIGGATVPNVYLGVINKYTDARSLVNNGAYMPGGKGVLGLGWGQLGQNWTGAAIGGAGVSSQWKEPSFAIALDRDPSKMSGTLTFGGLDLSKYEGTLKSSSVAQVGRWDLPLGGIKVAGIQVAEVTYSSAPINMLMDPTWDVIELPGNTTSGILSKIPQSINRPSGWTVPCNTSTILSMTFDGVEYPIDPATWFNSSAKANLDGRDDCYTYFESRDRWHEGSVTSRDRSPYWAPGDNVFAMGPLMRNFYASYEYSGTDPKIGLAKAVGGVSLADVVATTSTSSPATQTTAQASNGISPATTANTTAGSASSAGDSARRPTSFLTSILMVVAGMGVACMT